MRYINKLNDSAFQRSFLTGNENQRITFELRYMPTQRLWIAGIEFESFKVDGLAVVNSPNLLRQWKNIIPFGISCYSVGDIDPYRIDDFNRGRSRLFLLTAEEVQEVEDSFA